MTDTKCQRCGNAMAESERFCGECGWERPVETATAPPITYPDEVTKTVILDTNTGINHAAKETVRKEVETDSYAEKSTTPSPSVGTSASRTSKGALAALVGGILIITAGIGGYFYYRGSPSTAVQPVTTAPATQQQETRKPAEPVAEQPKSEVVQDKPVHTETPAEVQKPASETKKAQKPNVDTRKAVVKQKTEVVKETLPSKSTTADAPVKTSTPADSQDIGNAVSQVQAWLRNNNMYVVASVKNDVIVLKGAVKPEEKARLTARMKEMGVNYKDFVSVDLTTN